MDTLDLIVKQMTSVHANANAKSIADHQKCMKMSTFYVMGNEEDADGVIICHDIEEPAKHGVDKMHRKTTTLGIWERRLYNFGTNGQPHEFNGLHGTDAFVHMFHAALTSASALKESHFRVAPLLTEPKPAPR